jgi:hypothetical protein
VGLLARLLIGDGTLRPELIAAPRAEGLVRIEENLRGSVRYTRFKAPGSRFVWPRPTRKPPPRRSPNACAAPATRLGHLLLADRRPR